MISMTNDCILRCPISGQSHRMPQIGAVHALFFSMLAPAMNCKLTAVLTAHGIIFLVAISLRIPRHILIPKRISYGELAFEKLLAKTKGQCLGHFFLQVMCASGSWNSTLPSL